MVRNVVKNRYPGVEVDEDLLSRDLTAFLYALGAPNPDEYVKRLTPYRRLLTRQELADAADLHGQYRYLTGKDLSAAVDPQDALRVFWDAKGGAARPQEVATKAFAQVQWSKAAPADRPPGSVLAALICPSFSMYDQPELRSSWIATFSVTFPRLTQPTGSLEQALGRHGRVLLCQLCFAVRTTDRKTFVVSATFFFSPEQQRWYYELAGHAFPYTVWWPL
jgi:hypothetical protein